jgi:hypothetical protein
MQLKPLRAALHKQPFEPFSTGLTDGRSLPVPHTDFLALTPRRVIIIADDEIGSWSVIEPRTIVSIDSMPTKPKGGNGIQKK